MNEVSNLPAVPGGFSVPPDSGTGGILQGLPFRFRKGRYPVGRDEGDLLGATLCASGSLWCYQKWHDHKPVGVIVQRLGEWFPASADQIDDDGSPGEWQLTAVVYFSDLEWGHS
jgi:hypothetical protein